MERVRRSGRNEAAAADLEDQAYASAFHKHVSAVQEERITDQGWHQSIALGLVHFDGQGRLLEEQ